MALIQPHQFQFQSQFLIAPKPVAEGWLISKPRQFSCSMANLVVQFSSDKKEEVISTAILFHHVRPALLVTPLERATFWRWRRDSPHAAVSPLAGGGAAARRWSFVLNISCDSLKLPRRRIVNLNVLARLSASRPTGWVGP